MELPIQDPFGDDEPLICPSCGSDYLHHHGIAYFDREEDSKRGSLVFIQKHSLEEEESLRVVQESNSLMDGCPSPRRGGMVIGFGCESCPAISSLSIYQHKGQTYVEWTDITISEEEKPKRQPIKPSIRFQVLKRDGYRCQMCGATAQDGAKLEIDHIHPVSKGGSNEPSNLQVLCRDCNAGKRDQLQ